MGVLLSIFHMARKILISALISRFLPKVILLEYLVIAIFALVLLATMLLGFHLLYALSFGYVLFFLYGLYKGCSAKELIFESWNNAKNIGSLLLLFCLIAILTATWRASGTIAMLVVSSSHILIPSLFIFSTFLLCVFISLLTGTSFGTSATMGVICMTIGNVLEIHPAYLGGAILSGSYFGDRMSITSSSAHLVAKITQTQIFVNLRNMFSSCILPFILSSLLYILLGFTVEQNDMPLQSLALFERHFQLPWYTASPAIIMILLACFKVNAKNIMLWGIISASILCVLVQKMPVTELLQIYWNGFQSHDAALNAILGGGGLLSMLTVACIVSIASAYMGIFHVTNLFGNIKVHINHLAEKISPFGSTVITAIVTCMLTCNQTLSIFLTKSLCEEQYNSKEKLAHAIENSTVLIAGLIPWNIACSVVLANVQAPVTSIFYAFFLYLLPITSFWVFKRQES